jgi:hypothetical protein
VLVWGLNRGFLAFLGLKQNWTFPFLLDFTMIEAKQQPVLEKWLADELHGICLCLLGSVKPRQFNRTTKVLPILWAFIPLRSLARLKPGAFNTGTDAEVNHFAGMPLFVCSSQTACWPAAPQPGG